MKLWFNFFCRDIEAQFAFYQAVLGLPEALASRSPIYRALETDEFQFGLNAWPAYDLLGLQARRPERNAAPPGLTAYPTFMVDLPGQVEEAAKSASALGGDVIKPCYPTYYGQWQVVLADPEGNVFRVASPGLPEGVSKPALPVAG